MNTTATILRDIIIAKFGGDSQFDPKKITNNFLKEFAVLLCNFKNDAKPLYKAIYTLELEDPEKNILQLDNIHSSFIDELAENYALGNTSEICTLLMKTKNELFSNKVIYFKNLEKAIKKAERKRIKDTLPTSFELLTFEIPNNELELAIKKKAREDLRMKIKKWDSELIDENEVTIFNSYNSTEKTNIFTFSWVKYSIAACMVLGLGFLGIYNFKINSENSAELSKVESNEIKSKDKIQQIESIRIAEVRTIRKTVNLNESVALGFGTKTKKIKVVINDPIARISTLNEAIVVYRSLLEKEVGIGPISKKSEVVGLLNEKIEFSKMELKKLNTLINQYTFDGITLSLYTSSQSKPYPLYFNDHYYLKFEGIIYNLNITNKPQSLVKITDPTTLNSLNKIIFDNGI
jgi:hypothetical protein